VRLIDSGLCARAEPLAVLLEQVTNAVSCSLRKGLAEDVDDQLVWLAQWDLLGGVSGPFVIPFIGGVPFEAEPTFFRRHFVNAVSYLAHEEGIPTDQRGGLVLTLRFDADITDPAGIAEVCANAHYEFSLTGEPFAWCPECAPLAASFGSGLGDIDGIVRVLPHVNQLRAVGPAAQEFEETLFEGLAWAVPRALFEAFYDLQTIEIDINSPLCFEGRFAACDGAADFLAAGIEAGATNICSADPQHELCNPVPNADPLYDQSKIEQLQNALNELWMPGGNPPIIPPEKGGTRFNNWRCVAQNLAPQPSPLGPDGCPLWDPLLGPRRCRIVLRSKRLNVLPRHLEVVWFDGVELDNPVYALYVAAHSSMDPEAVRAVKAELCNVQEEAGVHTSTYLWPFSSLGYFETPV
jgi:hypothetical protein